MESDGIAKLVDWGVTHGVAGLSLLIAVYMAWDNRRKDRDLQLVQGQRIEDLKQYTSRIESIQDKVHKTADDMSRFLDYQLQQRRPR